MNLTGFFGHVDALPFIYGFFIFVNLFISVAKLKKGMLLSFAVDAAVFYGVFSMHGGSMTGSLAALIAATLSGIFITPMLRVRA